MTVLARLGGMRCFQRDECSVYEYSNGIQDQLLRKHRGIHLHYIHGQLWSSKGSGCVWGGGGTSLKASGVITGSYPMTCIPIVCAHDATTYAVQRFKF